jgi:hypothetical protein
MSGLLARVRDTAMARYSGGLADDGLLQTFRQRLLEVVDQAQHFAALGHASGGHSYDPTQSFREGLDATERERK